MAFRIAVDAGGTFTDGVLMSEKGDAITTKAHTTPRDPTIGTMNCISKLAAESKLTVRDLLSRTSTIVLGTTLATNVVATRSGAKMGTIATKGYRVRMTFPQVAKADWLEQRRDMYDFRFDAPQPLTCNHLMTEVEERVNCRGEVLIPLNEEDVRKAVRYLKGHQVDSIAVMLLHSPIYPKHEHRIAEIIHQEYPGVYVALSSVVLPVVGEVERWSTTMFSAYVAPAVTGYVSKMSTQLKKEGFTGELLFIQSNGGTATPDVVIDNPATILLSGPAAGPSLGLTLGATHDVKNVLSVDMGGTSFDVGVVHDGIVDIVQQMFIDAKKYAMPSVDVSAAGAGGGSIAHIDSSGRLQVGPKSAGASPGPACYGQGGEHPTVTDANVILGYVDPDYFLGGEAKLRKDLAEKAIREKIAEPLGISVVEAAAAIYNIINARMASATEVTFAKRGYDPRDFTLCAAGGAAAVHAVRMMEELGIRRLIIPKVAPTYCAYGMLFCDFKHDYQRAYWAETAKADLDEIAELYAEMEREALQTLHKEGIQERDVIIEKSMEVRYYGQFRQRTARVPAGPITKKSLLAAIHNFHEVHKNTVGYADANYPTEIVRLHLSGIGRTSKPQLKTIPRGSGDTSKLLKGTRRAYFNGHGLIETKVYDGNKLLAGDPLEGPCIIEERFTTFVLPPNVTCKVDNAGNYVTTLKGAAA
jgi:N-methylhydantoinase A